ncbi:hypothetical protein HU200_051215 [Digitaria exilis]|uniref:MATH domain-containing protein n=1 Tax=Digitaria exilis TaxID=1010633 RepID=A0A835E5G9_9POAL|nr:hypothetical protein HU200_051215 [Digitaria exilis]CAB3480053.1 unnamed protein product [Digitaria exilis]
MERNSWPHHTNVGSSLPPPQGIYAHVRWLRTRDFRVDSSTNRSNPYLNSTSLWLSAGTETNPTTMSPPTPPLISAGAGQPSRSASCFVAKPSRGFQLLRIDGYSWTKALPGGERITSEAFTVGDRVWCVDYYPNGTDPSVDESDSISLYLRLVGVSGGKHKERVRAQYRFSLLDLAGDAAYELPAETGVFTFPAGGVAKPLLPGQAYGYAVDPVPVAGDAQAAAAAAEVGCGHAACIAREELERRRGDSLLAEDCLVVRCDVGVTEVANPSAVAAGRLACGYAPAPWYDNGGYGGGDDTYALDGRGGQKQPPPVDDKEFIRRCLGAKRARE